jgi:hypothetical protein
MTQSTELILPARVLGCLQDGLITIILGYGVGLMDGGTQMPVAIELIPTHLRLPNTDLEVILQLNPWKILRIQAPSSTV